MLISLVSGTFNRIELLQKMIESFRAQMYRGIEYEIVLVDGGSTDGTIEWCKSSPDIKLIEQGELLGAINAFCTGAKAAIGDYVILANDDISFHENSVIAAMTYLEQTPDCGAVAFADNRFHQNHAVQSHLTRDSHGNKVMTPYAQVGMFRRWLGDAAGWWGVDDPEMQGARTYGGDNYLSSRIWEMGYTIDSVKAAIVHDSIERDDMRKINETSAESDARIFYKRFDGGAIFNSNPVNSPTLPEQLRILYLPLYEGNHQVQRQQKRGLRDALCKLGIVLEYDYIARHHLGVSTHNEITQLARAFNPDVLFTQVHGADTFSISTIRQLRGEHPQMICLNWNGDVWPEVYLNPDVVDLMRWYDLALVVNDDIVAQYDDMGITCAYWQVASEQPKARPNVPSHDVIFMANAYSKERQELGRLLKSLPYDVGLYGSGWGELGDGQTLYDFATSHALMRNAKIVIGDNQYPNNYGFVSNRIFETLYAGAFLLHQVIPGIKQLTGVKPDQHFQTWYEFDDLQKAIEYYLTNDDERNKIALRGQRYVKRKHTFDERVKELFLELIPSKVRRRDYQLA